MLKVLSLGLATVSAQTYTGNSTDNPHSGMMRQFLDDMQTYFNHSGKYDP